MSSTLIHNRLQENLRLGLTCVKELWHYDAKDWVTGCQAADINLDGDIEVVAGSGEGRVYALSRDGRKRWESVVGTKMSITALIACAPSAEQPIACVISTRDGKIYALDQNGKAISPPEVNPTGPKYWYNAGQPITQMHRDTSQPLTIVFAAEDHCAYSFDLANNRLRWRFRADEPVRAVFPYDIDGDGHAETLVGSDDQHLYVLSSTGEVLSSCVMDHAIYTLFAADIDKDGQTEFLISTRTKNLFVLDFALKPKWSYTLSSRSLAISVVDVNNDQLPEILVACDDQSLSILDNTGALVWRQKLNKRYHSLSIYDLDFDGHDEILAGADDAQVYALRIQLSKDLDKKIVDDYVALGKPEITAFKDLNSEQLDLLQGILGTTYTVTDKKLSLEGAQILLEEGHFTEALLLLLKLNRQRFQFLWEKEHVGYNRTLCLANITGSQQREVVVSSLDGGISVFTAEGNILWSHESVDDTQILDVQSGYFSSEQSENLAYISAAGSLSIIDPDKTHPATLLEFPEPVICFSLLALGKQSSSEILIGTASGKAYLYTNNFEKPARILDLPTPVQQVYTSEPDDGGNYHNPELLISTEGNQLFAYTRGGNCLWTYSTRSKIIALCAKDLDNDGRLEVLIGSEDRNISVLDDTGKLLWRYVLYHKVLALETIDLDKDGQQEILAGCADGVLYIFTAIGDLIWRYTAKDPIQALRAADINLDGNLEIVMSEEGQLEVLQIFNQQKFDELIALCWKYVLAGHKPIEALRPLIEGDNPYLRAAALTKLASLDPMSPDTLSLLSEAMKDPFIDVRKVLPEALMSVYPVDPKQARVLLITLFTDWVRDVRIEVVEHLDLLARHDWGATLFFLDRVIHPPEIERVIRDRNTRRAVLRKISHLLKGFAEEIKNSQATLGEPLFKLLLAAAVDTDSTRIREETGRVLADFFNLFEEEFLPYLYRLFANQLGYETLLRVSDHLASPTMQRVFSGLLTLKFDRSLTSIQTALSETTRALEALNKRGYAYSTGLWWICHELQELFNLSSIENLAAYEFSLKPEHFAKIAIPYPHIQTFLAIGEELHTITQPLKTYQHRSAPNDLLNSLLKSIDALETFQQVVDTKYNVSPLLDTAQQLLPEYVALKVLIARWQEMFSRQRNELGGHAELIGNLQSHAVPREETVGIWLEIMNRGRAPARDVQVTLLVDDSFANSHQSTLTQISQTFTTDSIHADQSIVAEFFIKPLQDFAALNFEITYNDSENDIRTIYRKRLDFVEWQQPFTPIDNPYTMGTHVRDRSMFYGRDTDLNYLLDNLTRTTAQIVLVLYGQRRSGKTTLLYQLATADSLSQHIPVMIDMQAWSYKLTLNKFLFNISDAIFKALTRQGLSIAEPQMQDFFAVPAAQLDPIFAFESFLDQVDIKLEDRKLILLLDEFEVLENQVKKKNLEPEIFEYLRSVIHSRHFIHFLFSGAHQIHELTSNYWSVFFNIARHYRLASRISSEGAEELITRPVANLEYEPLAVKKIRSLTADQPYLIHLVCRELVLHCNRKQKNYVTINDVNLVLRSVLETGNIHFNWLWDDKLTTQTQQLLLLVIAQGGRDESRALTLDDIIALYDQYDLSYNKDELICDLETLLDEDVIEATNLEQGDSTTEKARYVLPVGLLRQWLRKTKSLSALLDEGKQSDTSDKSYDPQGSIAGSRTRDMLESEVAKGED